MKAKPSRGVPALFHVAVAFAVFFSVMSSPLWKGSDILGGFRSNPEKSDASLFKNSSQPDNSKLNNVGGTERGRKILVAELDPTPAPVPPPNPPPRQ